MTDQINEGNRRNKTKIKAYFCDYQGLEMKDASLCDFDGVSRDASEVG